MELSFESSIGLELSALKLELGWFCIVGRLCCTIADGTKLSLASTMMAELVAFVLKVGICCIVEYDVELLGSIIIAELISFTLTVALCCMVVIGAKIFGGSVIIAELSLFTVGVGIC